MKTIIMLGILSMPVLTGKDCHGCNQGCEYVGGVCACDQVPETAPSVKPSDELPPKDKMPSYQRENIKADMPSSLAYEDAKQDQARKEADAQGKREAGIR